MYQISNEKFGLFVTELRKKKNLTQKGLAEKLYVSDKTVSKWERGLSMPNVVLLIPIADILDVTVTELLRGEKIDTQKNIDKKEIEELRSKKTAAGRKGGQASAKAIAQASAEAPVQAPAQAPAEAKTEQYNYVSISNLKDTTTTVPPSDFQPFAEVYELVTGSEPKVLNAEIEAVSAIIKAGGTPDDFRIALQGMQDKDYTISNMSSALTWTLKDIEKRKQPKRPNNVGRKPLSASLDEILADAPIFAEDK